MEIKNPPLSAGLTPSNSIVDDMFLDGCQSSGIPIKRPPDIDLYSKSLPIEPELEVFQVQDLNESPIRPGSRISRHESTRIPKVSIQQPSFEMRRAMSEPHIEMFNGENIGKKESRKHSGSMEFDTMMDNMKEKERPQTPPSQVTSDPGSKEEQGHLRSRREKFHARASEMALKIKDAGAAKFGELWKNRHKSGSPSTGSDVEFATEASEQIAGDSPTQVINI